MAPSECAAEPVLSCKCPPVNRPDLFLNLVVATELTS